MRRREFTLLGCLVIGWPLAARAQQPPKIAHIGWMSRGNASGAGHKDPVTRIRIPRGLPSVRMPGDVTLASTLFVKTPSARVVLP